MALQSQAPRSSGSQRYSGNSRRKKNLTPWLALLGLVVIIAGLIVLFSDPNASPHLTEADGNTDPGTPSQASSATTSTPGSTGFPTAATPSNAARTDTLATATAQATNTSSSTSQQSDANEQPISHSRSASTTSPDTRQSLGEAKDDYETGLAQLNAGNTAVGRAILSDLLFRDGALPRHEAQAVRERLSFINENTVFTKKLNADQIAKDPIISLHRVQRGEYLSTIGNAYRLPHQLIERINNVKARSLQVDQAIQVIKGPVHARVDKSDYRMDLYVEDPDGLRIYLKSYTVGLGEFDSTPIGKWIVKPGSKVGPANGGPSWVNPRTGERYDRNDPNIPIGEYWMALQGIDENTKDKKGYGIHATNDPESIGRQESMGCIRMRDEDVDQVFYTLFEGASVVEIVP